MSVRVQILEGLFQVAKYLLRKCLDPVGEKLHVTTWVYPYTPNGNANGENDTQNGHGRSISTHMNIFHC